MSWLQVEKRIGQLIENDQYFFESEKVENEPVAEEAADENAEIKDEIELDEKVETVDELDRFIQSKQG